MLTGSCRFTESVTRWLALGALPEVAIRTNRPVCGPVDGRDDVRAISRAFERVSPIS